MMLKLKYGSYYNRYSTLVDGGKEPKKLKAQFMKIKGFGYRCVCSNSKVD